MKENDQHEQMKLRFCNVLDRILRHFRELMQSKALVLSRVYERQSLDMGTRVDLEMTKVFDKVGSILLLFDLIEKDLRTMEATDGSSDAVLRELMFVKMYTDKLPEIMQKNLMSLIRKNMEQEMHISELAYLQITGDISLAESHLVRF